MVDADDWLELVTRMTCRAENTLSWVAAFAAIVHSEQGSTLLPGLPKKQTSPIR